MYYKKVCNAPEILSDESSHQRPMVGLQHGNNKTYICSSCVLSNHFGSISISYLQCNKLLYQNIKQSLLWLLRDKSHPSPSLSVKCAIKQVLSLCPHAVFQVHSHIQNLMTTTHQPRANCQAPHTLPVSEKSCGCVEVHWSGCHHQQTRCILTYPAPPYFSVHGQFEEK